MLSQNNPDRIRIVFDDHRFCHLADASSHAVASQFWGNILFEATTCVG